MIAVPAECAASVGGFGNERPGGAACGHPHALHGISGPTAAVFDAARQEVLANDPSRRASLDMTETVKVLSP